MDMTQLAEEPGWVGGFTRKQAAGAVFANGARVKKDKFREGDGIAKGTEGTVLGSIIDPVKGIYYFVEWDSHPQHAVGHVGWKLAKA